MTSLKNDSNQPAARINKRCGMGYSGTSPTLRTMVNGAVEILVEILEKDKKGEEINEITRLEEIIVSGSICSTAD